ncbi:hypothetical protein TWF281_011156 [Arthrobotrys megalospora]
MTTSLSQKLTPLTPIIREICEISGIAGLSYGVILKGDTHFDNFGYRDIENKLPPDENTIYHIASLTKAFTAAAVGFLVDEGKLEWETPLRTIMPELAMRDPEVTNNLAMLDVLSHRTGLEQDFDTWMQGDNHLLFGKDQTINVINHLHQIKPFRSEFQYNNWPFCLAGEIIEKVTGKSYGTVLEDKIFKPLGMDRSSINANYSSDSNYAKAYMPLDDRTSVQIPRPEIRDGTLMASAGGVRSCTRDLLKWAEEHLAAIKAKQGPLNLDNEKLSKLKELDTILRKHTPMASSGPQEKSYGLGWALTTLPNSLGDIGYNKIFVQDMPTVGNDSNSRSIIYHQGSMPGFTSAIFLIPDLEAAIVVLANSLGLTDVPDWVGQLLVNTISDTTQPNDYIDLAKRGSEAHIKLYPKIAKELADNRIKGTQPKPLGTYPGDYYNDAKTLLIQVSISEKGGLQWSFQGLESETYALDHYHNDVFTWHVTRDEDARRGRFTFVGAEYRQIKFTVKESGDIDGFIWAHNFEPPADVFKKILS